ncbi:MAG: SIMPL domain-containing protein [Burkholderiaceae bacterium]|nr:SIMPL domain-containing protein [Burkholderiaceae bacterium]
MLPGALLAQPSSAAANEAGAPLLRLQADASREVSDDVAVAVFRVEQEGAQPGPLQSAVNRVLESALADLRRDAALIVRSGQYGTYPRHARDGRIEGWRVRAELIAESSDVTAISRATATLSARMQVASVGFRLSQAARERTESELTSEAAKNFRDKARAAAIALGYAGADLVEANYTTDSPSLPTPLAQMRSAVAASAESVAVPLEPGRSRVTVGFSGAFRLTR